MDDAVCIRGMRETNWLSAESLLFNKELSYKDVIVPEYRELLWKEWNVF